MELLTGKQVKRLIDYLCPFHNHGELKLEEKRATIIAANTNWPHHYLPAFVQAAAKEPQSPLFIQTSFSQSRTTGGDEKYIKPINGVRRASEKNPVVEGAKRVYSLIENYVEDYGAKIVASVLDHYTLPRFTVETHEKPHEEVSGRRDVVRELIDKTLENTSHLFGKNFRLDNRIRKAYVNYLCSKEYVQFKQTFIDAVDATKVAWAMIDTEKIPPLLDFVITEEIIRGVRSRGNEDTIIEAEYGATGQSGDEIEYKPFDDKELESFKNQVTAFVKYTGAGAIAYDVGMKHAARKDEAFEPDVKRLLTVQRSLYLETGQHVPFAMHGGTGLKLKPSPMIDNTLPLGIIWKRNVNTEWLYTQALELVDWVDKHREEIMKREKKACGGMYLDMLPRISQAVIKKLEESNSFGLEPELIEILYR